MRCEYVYAGTMNLPLRLLVVCRNAANGLLIMQRPPTKCVANIPPGVGADSSRPYPCITKYTYSHNQICVFKSPHMHIRLPFCGCIHIRGHDKSAPTAADGLLIMLRSPTKLVANIPPGVGADSSRPYPCITKYTYSHNQICVFTLSHMHFRLPFRGCIHICGHDKSAPTAACGLPFRCERIAKTLQTDCDNATNTHEIHNEHPRNTQRTPTKCATNTLYLVGE